MTHARTALLAALFVASLLPSPPVLASTSITQAPLMSASSAKIVVVGDAVMNVLVSDSSPVPCGKAPFPAACDYDNNSMAAYPHVIDKGGNTIYDFPAAESSLGPIPIAQVLEVQVPRIPVDTDVIVVDAGRADAYAGDPAAGQAMFDKLVAALGQHAPHARLVFLNLRDARGYDATRTSSWNAHEASVAQAVRGRYLDLRGLFPMRDYADFPDTLHPGSAGSIRVAALLNATIFGGTFVSGMAGPVSTAPAHIAPAASNKSAVLVPQNGRLKIAVLGASMERNIVMDGSPEPCGDILSAPPCKFQDPSPLAYPNILADLVNATVDNFSVGGAQAADAKTYGKIPSVLEDQVPKMSPDTDVAILDIGVNDMSISGAIPSILRRADKVAAAVRQRAPHARIVFLGLRRFATSIRSRVNAWNAHEEHLAAADGAVMIDLDRRFPPTDYVDFPDGTHASVIGSLRIAQLIESAIEHMRAH